MLQEEKYITYILEDEGANTVEVSVFPPVSSGPTEDRTASPNSESNVEQQHHCSQCSYSSMYKANVIRHIKLVHDTMNAEESLLNGSDDKTTRSMPNLEEDEEVYVKKEAIEPEVIIAQGDEPIIKEEIVEPSPSIKTPTDEEILQEAAKSGAKYCKSCNIAFNYYKTFLAHKKFYCSSHAGEVTASSTNNNNNPTTRTAEASVL